MEEVKTAGGEVLYAAAATSDTDIVTQLYKSYDELNNPAFEGDKSAAYSAMLAAGAKDAPPQAKMVSTPFPGAAPKPTRPPRADPGAAHCPRSSAQPPTAPWREVSG